CATRAAHVGEPNAARQYTHEAMQLSLLDGCLGPGSPAVDIVRTLPGLAHAGIGPRACQAEMAAHDADFSRRWARAIAGRTAGGPAPPCVACLFHAVFPQELQQLRAMGRTFARHCCWSEAYVAAEATVKDQDGLPYDLDEVAGIGVVNLRGVFPDMEPDGEFAGGWGNQSQALDKTFFGNTIQKDLHMFLFNAEVRMDQADVFCRFDLDSVFIIENLLAYIVADNISRNDVVYLGLPLERGKDTFGEYPSGAAGVCLTQAALKVLAGYLQARADDRRKYPPGYMKQRDAELSEIQRQGEYPAEFFYSLSCDFFLGHWDDVVLGSCFRSVGIACHGGCRDRFGRALFSYGTLPVPLHNPRRVPTNRSYASRPEAYFKTVRAHWSAEGFLHHYLACEPVHLASSPSWWVVPHVVSFGGAPLNSYRNLSWFRRCLLSHLWAEAQGALGLEVRQGGRPLARRGVPAVRRGHRRPPGAALGVAGSLGGSRGPPGPWAGLGVRP
ncbi:unnamed protein product, partial [Prorocentrum cordatum]